MPKEPDRTQRKVLGKGLSALLPTRQFADIPAVTVPDVEESAAYGKLQSLPLEHIYANDEQPRVAFAPEKLEELAQSLRAQGLLQPITVYETGPQQYRIIAGERRWRAAKIAGFTEIPALIRTVEEDQLLELALIENIQREDLNPLEIASALQSLAENHHLSHEQLAERTGKDRSTITNTLRLLRLSIPAQLALTAGRISSGHARALLNLPDEKLQEEICQKIVAGHLSVRETERLVKQINSPAPKAEPRSTPEPFTLDANIKAALTDMAMILGTKVNLFPKTPTSGRLEIEYYSQEDLDRIYAVITKE